MDVDGSIVDFCGLTPDGVEQLGAGEYTARPLQEIFEQAEMRRTEMDVARAASHPAHFAIEVEVASCRLTGAFGTPACPF